MTARIPPRTSPTPSDADDGDLHTQQVPKRAPKAREAAPRAAKKSLA
ncbi:MAG: hypothetical protein AABY18_09630 [Candidatus Thermoplasmatota archaeon]